MPEVVGYVKNQSLGFTIPYTLNGDERQYYPDFIVRLDDGHGADDLLNLIVEVTGEAKKDKAAKVATARTLWVPAVNNHGGFGRWASSRSPTRGTRRTRSAAGVHRRQPGRRVNAAGARRMRWRTIRALARTTGFSVVDTSVL